MFPLSLPYRSFFNRSIQAQFNKKGGQKTIRVCSVLAKEMDTGAVHAESSLQIDDEHKPKPEPDTRPPLICDRRRTMFVACAKNVSPTPKQ